MQHALIIIPGLGYALMQSTCGTTPPQGSCWLSWSLCYGRSQESMWLTMWCVLVRYTCAADRQGLVAAQQHEPPCSSSHSAAALAHVVVQRHMQGTQCCICMHTSAAVTPTFFMAGFSPGNRRKAAPSGSAFQT